VACGSEYKYLPQRRHESCSFLCQYMAPHQYLYCYLAGYIIFNFQCSTNNGECKGKIKYAGFAEWYDDIFVVACN
jgi:hypothetical protein